MDHRGILADVEAVIFCGVQGSGKTTLYRDRFLETHARISMDLLRTRPREAAFLRTCLEAGLRDVARRLVRPMPEEGFDELFHATALDGDWRIEPLLTTPPLF